MKKRKNAAIILILAVLLAVTSCGIQQDGRRVIKEPGKEIIVIENEDIETDLPRISVEKIQQFEDMEITDWLDENTVLLAKENRELEKMSLAENAGLYPRSLYLYNVDTEGYETVKAVKNVFLGGAEFSPDKKHLLYYEYSIGDTAYYLMNMDEDRQSSSIGKSLGLAYTAAWADAGSVIGASYAGGAYTADLNGKLGPIAELQETQLYAVRKAGNKLYYITGETASPAFELNMIDSATGEKKNLGLESVFGIFPSPDGKQLLIIQGTGSAMELLLADADGNISKNIAKGAELTGISWSSDQRMIAYRLKSADTGATGSGLYIYDAVTGKSTQIAVDMGGSKTSWSPSGKKIAVTEFAGGSYNSSIIYLK